MSEKDYSSMGQSILRRLTSGFRKHIYQSMVFIGYGDGLQIVDEVTIRERYQPFRLISSFKDMEEYSPEGFWYRFGDLYEGLKKNNSLFDVLERCPKLLYSPCKVQIDHPSMAGEDHFATKDFLTALDWVYFTDTPFDFTEYVEGSTWRHLLLAQWEVKEDHILITAYHSDLHYMIKYKLPLLVSMEEDSFFMPKRLPRVLRKSNVELHKDDEWIYLLNEDMYGKWCYKFPRISQSSSLVPLTPKGIRDPEPTVIIDKATLLQAMLRYKMKGLKPAVNICLTKTDGWLTGWEAEEEHFIVYDLVDDDITLCLNLDYLYKFLRLLPSDRVHIDVSYANSQLLPLIVWGEDKESHLFIMPIN